MRTPEELLASGLAVIESGLKTPAKYFRERRGSSVRRLDTKYPTRFAPLFSGGHDSTCACHLASHHPMFDGKVHHIDTKIGAKRTRKHVEDTAKELGWELVVWESPATYEKFVTKLGFPGPGGHTWIYAWLKDRCVGYLCKGKTTALITGCRSQESDRRMGHVEPLKIGEMKPIYEGDEVVRYEQVKKNRYWIAPCHDWSREEQIAYMNHFDLPINPVKVALGMSGECFCGAFASPGELERIRVHTPDVAEEIDRLAKIAAANGKPCVWGVRPPKDRKKGILKVARTGELCNNCDLKAARNGVLFDNPVVGACS